MTPEELFEKIKPTIDEVLKPPKPPEIDSLFGEDLDADSLDLVELVMAFEEMFGIDIPEDRLEGIRTVREAIKMLQEYIKDYPDDPDDGPAGVPAKV